MCVTQKMGLYIHDQDSKILKSVLCPHQPAAPGQRSSSQPHLLLQDIYENLDLRQRRASSPGYIDSPTYSRQGMSPTFSRSPHHYYRSGKEGKAPE